MRGNEAERIEDQLDDVLATSLHNEVGSSITVRVSDPQLAALRTDHAVAWRFLNGPITASIVVVLDIGPFHLAWDITEPEEAPITRLLERARSLTIIIIGDQEPRLRIDVPPIPNQLRPNLMMAYLPVSAA